MISASPLLTDPIPRPAPSEMFAQLAAIKEEAAHASARKVLLEAELRALLEEEQAYEAEEGEEGEEPQETAPVAALAAAEVH